MKIIASWQAPDAGGAPLLTMPNVPLPLHKQCPRNIMSTNEWQAQEAKKPREKRRNWQKTCKTCYETAGDVCEICGQKLSGKLHDIYPMHQSHELYSYDYENYTATFERCVCLCRPCHMFIHSGRALTCYQKHEPLWDKQYMLSLAERGFALIQQWNHLHPDDEPLRVYETFNDWLEEPSLSLEMQELLAQYEIKMYSATNRTDWENAWGKWKLVFEGKEYPGLYTSKAQWREEMDKNGGHNDQVDLFSDESISVMSEVENGFWED